MTRMPNCESLWTRRLISRRRRFGIECAPPASDLRELIRAEVHLHGAVTSQYCGSGKYRTREEVIMVDALSLLMAEVAALLDKGKLKTCGLADEAIADHKSFTRLPLVLKRDRSKAFRLEPRSNA